jgi:hypothetical protein
MDHLQEGRQSSNADRNLVQAGEYQLARSATYHMSLHTFCIPVAQKEIEAADSDAVEGNSLFSVACNHFSKIN